MKILAVDSSGQVASVALLEEDTIVGEYTINYKLTHSQTLLPMMDALKKITDLDLETIDAIAVAAGPGSFTGLRIGSATVKGMGLALDKPIIAVPTLEGLAYRQADSERLICPLMDARRNQVYTGLYKFSDGEFEVVKNQCACDINEIIEAVNSFEGPVIFLGDGAVVFEEVIKEKCIVNFKIANASNRLQSAAAVALRAKEMYLQGQLETADMHRPEYLRVSQAERERLEREQQKN